MAGYDRFYYLKKAWPLFPGIVRPMSAPFLAPYYDTQRTDRGFLRMAADALVGMLFHLWVTPRANLVQRRYGLDAAWRRNAVAIARHRFVDPNDIALFGIRQADELDQYVRRFEDARINKRINPRGWMPDCVMADKLRFAERCEAFDLPHPETIATVRARIFALHADPAKRPLVIKPAGGEGGSGIRIIGPLSDHASLKAEIGRVGADIIVQAVVPVHPALSEISLNALPTVRIVTILDEQGIPEAVSATFRCASDPTARVDNMKAGGLIAPVSLEEGRLGTACFGYDGGDHQVHPANGAPIAGRILPCWPEAVALVTQAHQRAFGEYTLIGWDVALTSDGPVLIEGNGKPGILMPQRAARRGLGAGRYGALLAHHLAKKA